MTYAQTNLQLYAQLRAAGYAEADLARVCDAYGHAAALFSGQYRASGKTFLAHLVGTASVAASVRARVEVVVAALLHAAYEAGDFGVPERGPTAEKRRMLQARVGPEVEELVARYAALPWTAPGISAFVADFADTPAEARDAMVVRLANEVEEYLDDGWVYVTERRQAQVLAMIAACGPQMHTMAGLLGVERLGTELRRFHARHDRPEGTDFAAPAAADASYTLVPPSLRQAPAEARPSWRQRLRDRVLALAPGLVRLYRLARR